MSKIFLLECIYRGSRVVAFFWLCWLGRLVAKSRWIIFLGSAFFFLLFIWARFREPQQIYIDEYTIDIGVDKRVVLISDLHLGMYKDRVYLQKIVYMINRLDAIDMVLIAGDFTYWPGRDQPLDELFEPLSDIDVPVYAVLGNHDIEHPGPDLRDELVSALYDNNVHVLQNDVIQFDDFFLVGLGPYLGNEDKVSILDQFHVVNNVLVLTHNPDTTLMYRNYNADLTLVGHTHCGQMRLPWIHDWLRSYYYPVEGDFDCGLRNEAYTRLFITPGIGEVLLPMRFRAPPTISVLQLG